MDIEKLIEDLRGLLKQYGEKIPYGESVGAPWPYSKAGDLVWPDPEPYFIEQAATVLSTLQAENEEMQKQLNIFSEFLCYMTGGLLSKTNYTAQEMVTAAEDYQQSVCDDCDKVNVIGNDELIDEVQAIQDKNEKLRAENSILRKMQPVELSGESAKTFALAMEVSELQAKVDQERTHRIHAEQHADAFLKDCERLNAELERVTAERDAAVKDIWAAKWISCKYGTGCDFISARTGCPDCAGCGGWEWRGIKEED